MSYSLENAAPVTGGLHGLSPVRSLGCWVLDIAAVPPLVWHFDRLDDDAIEKLVVSDEETGEREPKKNERLYCAACGYPITHRQARKPVNGAHEHQFTNPHGISFHIGCYAEAPGCVQVGEATEEHSWFPGHAWRIAGCASCQQHLGWGFHGRDGGRFFGLIVDRLSLGTE